jgi:hypothetical protein
MVRRYGFTLLELLMVINGVMGQELSAAANSPGIMASQFGEPFS